MTRPSSLTQTPTVPSLTIRLGLVLVLLTGIAVMAPTSSVLANDQTGALAPTNTISLVSADDQFDAISAGSYHTCGLKKDGSLSCWGYDGYGQVSGPNAASGTFKQVSAGGSVTCGLKLDGRLACWGHNQYGQVSGPNASSDTFTQVSAGGLHTCGVKQNGRLACWGSKDYQQVSGPNGSTATFAQVNAGLYHTCGVTTNGNLVCWGDNWYQQVSGPNGSSDTFTQIEGGSYHTCGLKTDRELACWGHDWYGQVSNPNASSEIFIQVSAGFYHTCGVKTDGDLVCWGYNGYGQVLGPSRSPEVFSQVSAGGFHTCGLKTDGTLACWGNNDYGQAPSFNQPPTDITLSNSSIDENQPINTQVGTLATSDPNSGDTHAYSLVNTAPCPGPDNNAFNISSNQVRTSAIFDYETKNSYAICIRTDDGQGGTRDKPFTISANNVNEAPLNTVPGTQSTTASAELTFSASKGTSISISDVDAGENPIKVTLMVSNGTLTLNGTSGLTFSAGDGTADTQMVLTGKIASINASLEGISFNLAPSHNGAASFRLITDDQGYSGSGGPRADDDTVDIIVEPAAAPDGNRIFLPIILGRASASTPDLVVEGVSATRDGVTLTIKNIGTAPVVDAFWVDVYFNPTQTPGLNKPWEAIASHGLVWGVTTPIPAGGSLVLTSGGDYFFSEYSSNPPQPVGADVYALVDSINHSASYGAVQEGNEANNLFGPVTSTDSVGDGTGSVAEQAQSAAGVGLPPRQLP